MVATSVEAFPDGRIRLSRRVTVDRRGQRIDGLFVGRPPLYLWQEGADDAPTLQMWLADDCLVFLDEARAQCRVRLGGSPADYGRAFASIVQGPGSALLDAGPESVRQGPVKAGIRYHHRDPRAYVQSATFDTDSLPVDLTTSDFRVTWSRVDVPDSDAQPRMPDFRSWRIEVYEHEPRSDARQPAAAAAGARPDEAFAYRSGAMPRPQLHAIWGAGPERVRMSMGVPVERGHLAREAVRAAGGGIEQPVIVTGIGTRAEAAAGRVSWLTSVQPQDDLADVVRGGGATRTGRRLEGQGLRPGAREDRSGPLDVSLTRGTRSSARYLTAHTVCHTLCVSHDNRRSRPHRCRG